MVWKYGDVQLKAGKGWTDSDGTKHPNNWMIWSNEDKESSGLTWEDDSDTSYDDRFYWAKDVARSLTDINVVDDDGNAVIDPITNVQQVQLGLKSIWIAKTKATANSMLSTSDWYIVRSVEESIAIPNNISTFRDNVRTATSTIETAINACADLDAFKALFVVPVDSEGNPSGKSPITNFPDEVN